MSEGKFNEWYVDTYKKLIAIGYTEKDLAREAWNAALFEAVPAIHDTVTDNGAWEGGASKGQSMEAVIDLIDKTLADNTGESRDE